MKSISRLLAYSALIVSLAFVFSITSHAHELMPSDWSAAAVVQLD